ncbi:MAG: hypothetical protein H6738_13120 [Alphaproteobacteria bacterium]|nr:hypothetical protein [Alphaproteobacteria bacterium]MCB9697717.1 hypothetical protein [Alphaproteobacteria bacterium]
MSTASRNLRPFVILPLVAVALAPLATVSAQEPHNPKHIEVQLPEPDPPGLNPNAPLPENQVVVPAPGPSHTAATRVVRREKREAVGTPPTSLSGRWAVVQVTDLGETEDFVTKMERSAMALDADCKTVAMIFDFGPSPATPTLPRTVEISERRECYKGGLGRYMSEITLKSGVSWGMGDQSQVLMRLPEMRADSNLVRLKFGPDTQTPPQWLGPDTRTERERSEYAVLTEFPKRGNEETPIAVHLSSANGQTLHLEPFSGMQQTEGN